MHTTSSVLTGRVLQCFKEMTNTLTQRARLVPKTYLSRPYNEIENQRWKETLPMSTVKLFMSLCMSLSTKNGSIFHTRLGNNASILHGHKLRQTQAHAYIDAHTDARTHRDGGSTYIACCTIIVSQWLKQVTDFKQWSMYSDDCTHTGQGCYPGVRI